MLSVGSAGSIQTYGARELHLRLGQGSDKARTKSVRVTGGEARRRSKEGGIAA
jgi:hypothetical protein